MYCPVTAIQRRFEAEIAIPESMCEYHLCTEDKLVPLYKSLKDGPAESHWCLQASKGTPLLGLYFHYP